MGNKIKNIFKFIFSRSVTPDGVTGSYDIKQYHSLKYALIYAKNEPVYESDGYDIYTRNYKDTTLVNILVYNEALANVSDFTYDKLKPMIIDKGLTAKDDCIILIAFQNKNDETIKLCKSLGQSTKHYFIQGLVYDEPRVTLDYYISVPDFYPRLYEAYCEDIYFDFAAVDPTRE